MGSYRWKRETEVLENVIIERKKKIRRDLKLEEDWTHCCWFWRWKKGPWANVCGWPLEAGNGPQMGKEIEKKALNLINTKNEPRQQTE